MCVTAIVSKPAKVFQNIPDGDKEKDLPLLALIKEGESDTLEFKLKLIGLNIF